MDIRELVKKHWADAKLYSEGDPQTREFLEHFDAHADLCWEDGAALVRGRYSALYNRLVQPLAASNDKNLRLHLIRQLDPAQPRELETLQRMVAQADPVADRPELRTIQSLRNEVLDKEIAKHPALIAALRDPPAPPVRPVTNALLPPPTEKP